MNRLVEIASEFTDGLITWEEAQRKMVIAMAIHVNEADIRELCEILGEYM